VNWTMEASIYDQELGMASDELKLFGGQGQLLLTMPDTPAWPADLTGQALQGWTDEYAGQLGGPSPVEDILQGSIWSDNVYVSTSEHISSSLFQKESLLTQERNLSRLSSSDEAFLLYESCDNAQSDLTLTDQTSLDVLAPLLETHSLGLSPIGANSEDEIMHSFDFSSESSTLWDQGLEQNAKPLVNSGTSKISPYAYDALLPLQNRLGLDGMSQEVPCDVFDPDDPVSVCMILKLLGDDINLSSLDFSSPVSPEEVDSVFSQDSITNAEVVKSEVCSPHAVPDIADTSFSDSGSSLSTLSLGTYLQHEWSGKADPSRSFSAAIGEPYCGEKKVDRREKKKEQNKTAAHRYRVKKREEKGVVKTEVEELEEKNAKLKSRADDLTREISYLRALLDEIKKQ